METSWPATDAKLSEIAAETAKDTDLSQVMNYIINGWPDHARSMPEKLHEYFAVRNVLSVSSGLVTYMDRIVIPSVLHEDIMTRLHAGHQGITKCQELAENSVWWPGINTHIKHMCLTCEHCEAHRPTQRAEPLMPTPLPEGPWKMIGIDLCQVKQNIYMVVVDYYSRFIEIVELARTTSRAVISKLQVIFARHGIPEVVRTDNASQFDCSEFRDFGKNYNFELVTSSPHFAQSNGQAESAVRIAKHILQQDDPLTALMLYRATPHSATKYSPAELLYSRKLRTHIPSLPATLKPHTPSDIVVAENDAQAKSQNAYYYNRRHGARTLTPLHTGDKIRVKLDHQKQWTPATVAGESDAPRSYLIDTGNGILRRNRRHIMPSSVTPAVSTHVAQRPDADIPPVHSAMIDVPDSGTLHTRSGRAVKPPSRLNYI